MELRKHIKYKHTVESSSNENAIKCTICGEQFYEKGNLMEHRKDKHVSAVAFCRNKREGRCIYSDDKCWWNHSAQSRNLEDNNKCYLCEKTFVTRRGLMMHKKTNHEKIVRTCNYFRNGDCRFREESCWYKHSENENHENKDMDVDEDEDLKNMDVDKVDEKPKEKDVEEENVQNSVFQKARENLKPPIKSKSN